MLKRKRKGFTLVELLVVIAILAILATVSVVGYTQFTKKAKLSNDQTTVTMLNDNLRALAVEKQPETASEALSQLYTVGFTKDKFTTYSTGYHYVYDRAENKFYLADEKGNITFPETKTDTTNMWALYKNQDTDKVGGVQNYVALEPITNQTKFNSVFGGGYM